MTMITSMPRHHSLAEELTPHRAHSFFPLESEAHRANPPIDQHLSATTAPIGGSAASRISFGPMHMHPTQRLLLEGDRKALGDEQRGNRYIVNMPGRGYRFVAPVRFLDEPGPPALRPATTAPPHNLPAQLTRLIGRDDDVRNLVQQRAMRRLLTIAGPGGIGKTVVAFEVAEKLVKSYEHGVWPIDLAPIADPRLVPHAVAVALGLENHSEMLLPALIAALWDKRMLLVLDNCEHVVASAARLAAGMLRGAPNVQILATSREPLCVDGEHLYRLPPLASPPASLGITAEEALGFPAVQLFVEHAARTIGEFELSDRDAPFVADICRRVDGLPLAIEFAAARVVALGVRRVAAELDDRVQLLTNLDCMASPRRRSLGATLDWSYALLSEAEQIAFRRLAIFTGKFTLYAAATVAADAGQGESEMIDLVTGLVRKSLLIADTRATEPRFCLLETTRAYALAKLVESGEVDALRRRHAACCQQMLGGRTKEMSSMSEFAAGLSPRERSVLELIGQGQSNKEIARALSIAPETVKSHVKNIFAKLGVQRRAQAVYRAQSLGLATTASAHSRNSYVDVYGPRPIATALTDSGSVTTADVYPAS